LVPTSEGKLGKLRIADDEGGRSLWPTDAEAQRAQAEAQRAAALDTLRSHIKAQRTWPE